MDIGTVLSSVIRRWYVSLVVLLLTGLAATSLWSTAVPEYTGNTTLVVLPSTEFLGTRAANEAGESPMGNPFGSGATGTLAALLADSINAGGISLPPEADGVRVAVAANSQRSTDFFTVEATGPSPEAVEAALNSITEQAPLVLAEIQTTAGSPPDQLYTSDRTRTIGGSSVAYPDRLRMVLGVTLAGLLVAALLSATVDSALLRRARSRARRSGQHDAVPTTAPAPARITAPALAPAVIPPPNDLHERRRRVRRDSDAQRHG